MIYSPPPLFFSFLLTFQKVKQCLDEMEQKPFSGWSVFLPSGPLQLLQSPKFFQAYTGKHTHKSYGGKTGVVLADVGCFTYAQTWVIQMQPLCGLMTPQIFFSQCYIPIYLQFFIVSWNRRPKAGANM